MLWLPLATAPADPVRDARAPGAEEAADEALVAAFKGGDVRTFDALFARYGPLIFGYIYRSVGDPALAEELTQDVFLKAFLHLRRTATETTLARRPVAAPAEEALALLADRAASDPEQRLIQREQRRAVRRTLDALPAHYRQALILRQWQGLSYAEIGEALGISVEAVTSLIHRARQAFRAAYSQQEQETER